MSISQTNIFICQSCNTTLRTCTWKSINTDLKETIPSEIINGSLFNIKCPNCGNITKLSYPLLYHDLRHKSMIWLLPFDIDNYDKMLSEIRQITIPSGYSTRLVHTVDELREKVSALESGRDDRLIEFCKIHFSKTVFKNNPELIDSKPFYLYFSGKETISFINSDGSIRSFVFQDSLYKTQQDQYSALIKNTDLYIFPEVSNSWAEAIIREHDSRSGIAIIDSASYCYKCGKPLVADSSFCTYCGAAVPMESYTYNDSNTNVRSQASQNDSQISAPSYSASSHLQNYPTRKKSFFSSFVRVVLTVLCITIVLPIVLASCVAILGAPTSSPNSTATTTTTVTPDANLKPITATNGQIFEYPRDERVAPLSVTASFSYNYYIYLDCITNPDNDMAFFVKRGNTVKLDVPLGTYRVYYATGDIWYGTQHLFGSSTIYCKCDGTFNFYISSDGYYSGYTLELIEQHNGNLDTETVNPSEFPR